MFGILMEYHIIFMVVCLLLFFGAIFLIWLDGTKQACVVATILLSVNMLFCLISIIGFFSIGYTGYNVTTGTTMVYGYEEMQMFNKVFVGLLWINGVMLYISIFKYMRIVIRDQMKGYMG